MTVRLSKGPNHRWTDEERAIVQRYVWQKLGTLCYRLNGGIRHDDCWNRPLGKAALWFWSKLEW